MLAMLIPALPWILVSGLIGYLGKDRKFGFWGNFAVSLILSPLVGIVVFFAQSKTVKEVKPAPAAPSP